MRGIFMKIGVMKYKVDDKHAPIWYLGILNKSISGTPDLDLVVGPDYALANNLYLGKVANFGVIKRAEAALLRQKMKYLSLAFPDMTIVPGTMPRQLNDNQMVHSAFIYRSGDELNEFRKQTDHGEADIAKAAGLEYLRAPGAPAVFDVKGKKAWLHICGDRGRKPESICSDSDLEITVAHDANAGFHIGINTPRNPRHMILSDSFHPIAAVQRYDSATGPVIVQPVSSHEHMEVFELK